MERRTRFQKWYTRKRRERDDRNDRSSDDSEAEVEVFEDAEDAEVGPAIQKKGRYASRNSSSPDRIHSNDENQHDNSNLDSEESQGGVQVDDADNLEEIEHHNMDPDVQQESNAENSEDDDSVREESGAENSGEDGNNDVNSEDHGSGGEGSVEDSDENENIQENDGHRDIIGGNGGGDDNSFDGRSEGSVSDNSDRHISSDEERSSEEEEASSEEEGNENQNVEDDMPLFPGAPLTLRQSLIAILTFSLTHKLTGVCISDLLSLIGLHCGPNEIGLKTLFRFKSYFSMIGKKCIDCHYYCSVCEIRLPDKNAQCNTCLGRHEVAYFIMFPIIDQLKVMYSREGFRDSLNFKNVRRKKNVDNFEDIYDGRVYQDQINNGFLANPDNISFFMYFDGVSLFKSSKFSIWPLFLSINELKFQERVKKENVVLSGLWFGKSKPNPNLFLNPLVDQIRRLQTDGEVMLLPGGGNIRVKAKIIGAVADLPAKALFMRMSQYNGLHSCFYCLSGGGRYDLGNNTIQVFPYSRNWEPRCTDDMIDFAERAVVVRQRDPDASVYGVRGPTLMCTLLPDVINCLGIDIMHGTFLNLMKTLLSLFFGPEYQNEPFSIAPFINIVDERLKNIKPPFSFQRLPRSIKKELALYKASDFKYLMMYYSLPVLLGILPPVYWLHHSKLVSAISLLSQESVSHEQVDLAEELLHSYVSDVQVLYGLRFVGLNTHQLLHLCDVVRNLGPAWVYSCFFYESLNGDLSRLVHGTRHAALQIASSSYIFMNLGVMINSLGNCDAKTLCLKFLASQDKAKVTEFIDPKTGVVGRYKNCNPVPRCISAFIEETFDFVGGQFRYFLRLKRKGVVYCSENYTRSIKKQSCYIQILIEDIPYLCKILSFVKWSSCNNDCPPRCDECRKCFLVLVKLYERILWEVQENGIDVAYINKVTPTNTTRVVEVSCITTPCIYMHIADKEYMAIPINSIESE